MAIVNVNLPTHLLLPFSRFQSALEFHTSWKRERKIPRRSSAGHFEAKRLQSLCRTGPSPIASACLGLRPVCHRDSRADAKLKRILLFALSYPKVQKLPCLCVRRSLFVLTQKLKPTLEVRRNPCFDAHACLPKPCDPVYIGVAKELLARIRPFPQNALESGFKARYVSQKLRIRPLCLFAAHSLRRRGFVKPRLETFPIPPRVPNSIHLLRLPSFPKSPDLQTTRQRR